MYLNVVTPTSHPGPSSPASVSKLSVHNILKTESAKLDEADANEYVDLEAGNCISFRESVLRVLETNSLPQVEQLMAMQGMRDYRDKQGHNALVIASRLGHIRIAKYLVEVQHMDPLVPADDGSIASHWAVINGNYDLARWFVEVAGVDPSTPDDQGNNMLHYAACCGRLETARWLVKEKGLNMNQKNKLKKNPVDWAKSKRQYRISQFFLEFKEGVDEVGMRPTVRQRQQQQYASDTESDSDSSMGEPEHSPSSVGTYLR
jgi:ankyrin repeat protein